MKSNSHLRHDKHQPWNRLGGTLSTFAAVATMACALLSACGGGATPGDKTATAPDAATPPGAATASFVVVPARARLSIGKTTLLVAVVAKGAPRWSSSDPSVASIDADGTVHALLKGNVVITATTDTGSASSAVSVYRTEGANPDPTSEALIGKALSSGTIDAEQALVYRVFAQLDDARLPAAYDGAPNATTDHLILREAGSRLAKLSAANQAILRPFFIPPVYPQSWHAQQVAAILASQGAGRVVAQSANRGTLGKDENCEAARIPDFWRQLSTRNFNIHYVAVGLAGFEDIDAPEKALAESIAAVIEEVYAAETGLLGRFAKADTDQPCNGGDGATDIYLGSLEPRTMAMTVPYGESCADTASFIIVNSHWAHVGALGMLATRPAEEGKGLFKSVLAHEVMHVLQFAMNRAGDCANLKWFDEATAEWAMDFVVPVIIDGNAGAPGMEDGVTKVAHLFGGKKVRSGEFLATYLYTGHMRRLEDGVPLDYGYADYLFFQYLHRKYGNSAIKGIFDAMAGGAGDLEAIAAAVDMKTAWPAFALTLWNDAKGKVLDYWSTQDGYDFGLWDVFDHSQDLDGAPTNLKPIEIDQKGQPRATFTLLDNALIDSKSGDYEIAPRSMFYEHLKFTDATVRSVYLLNPVGANPSAEFMKVQVVMKIDGEWKAPEDWTQDSTKQFCRDKKSERLEEILIVVSNSEVDRLSEKPFRIPKLLPMRVSTSNVGCWKWQGSASSIATLTTPFPGDNIVTATGLTFEVASVLPGRLVFLTTGGMISASSRLALGLCSVTLDATPRAAAKLPVPDGTIDINLDLDLGFGGLGAVDPPDRGFLELSGVSSLVTLTREVCPTGVRTASGGQVWSWLVVDDLPSLKVSTDGQTIEGQQTTVAFGTTTKTTWKFSAVRE